jgi:DNA-binding NtrC family response regulator
VTHVVEIVVFSNDKFLLEALSETISAFECKKHFTRNSSEILSISQSNKDRLSVYVLDVAQHFALSKVVHEIKTISPQSEIILLSTTSPQLDHDIFDVIIKPFHVGKTANCIRNAYEKCLLKKLVQDNNNKIQTIADKSSTFTPRPRRAMTDELFSALPITGCELIGENSKIVKIRENLREISRSDMSILIRGESGVGKDIIARLIHQMSGRGQKGNFIKINCPAIPEHLFESELFGHEKGAFTGAETNKPGRFEMASEGTIFLDEIAEIPMVIQAKLLQFIEHKQYTRLGGVSTLDVSARILSATNAPLERMIAQNQFRSDLYYRLNEYNIVLPPLRERVEDIPLLVDYFCGLFSKEKNCDRVQVSDSIMSKLIEYDWPGNIRELKAVVRSFVYSLNEDNLLLSISSLPKEREFGEIQESNRLVTLEKQAILSALQETRWNQRKASTLLGISYSTIRRKIKAFGL